MVTSRGAAERPDLLKPDVYKRQGNDRGLGLADMASAIRSGRPHRANGQLAFHVLDIMMGIYDAWEARSFVTLESTCERPQPMPADLKLSLIHI